MKIVLIHGQSHKGSSYHIGTMLVENIEGEKEIKEFFLPRDLNHFCLGCYQCIEGDEKCPYFEEKNEIMKEVEAADLLIFTTPTYCVHASAPLKSFIDMTFTYWMVHRPRACMFLKRAVVISTAAGNGFKSAIKDVTTALFYWGVPEVKGYGLAVQAMNYEMISDKRKAKIKKDISVLAKKLSNKINKKPYVGIKTRIMFKIMGSMQAAGMGSSFLEKEYWEKNGWLQKNRPWK